jgi:hypothetical protein
MFMYELHKKFKFVIYIYFLKKYKDISAKPQ